MDQVASEKRKPIVMEETNIQTILKENILNEENS